MSTPSSGVVRKRAGRGLDLDGGRLMDGVEYMRTIQGQVRDFANSFNAQILVLSFHRLLPRTSFHPNYTQRGVNNSSAAKKTERLLFAVRTRSFDGTGFAGNQYYWRWFPGALFYLLGGSR